MKKVILSITLVSALFIALAGMASADNGPHGGFNSPTTDSCAGCHRAHTATAQKLLSVSTANLCESCHGSAATGADTNVWDGVYVQRDATTENPAEGVPNRGLRAGGFVNTIMDTDLNGSAASAVASSNHTFDNSNGIAWGSGAIGSGPGATIALDCGDCHNPHGNAGSGGAATYRILKPIPNGSGAATPVEVADPATKNYTVDDPNSNYWGQDYGVHELPLGQWCSQCHTRYLASASGSDPEDTASGDPIFAFRHRSDGSDGVTCLDCHVAHGTSAAMGTNSGAVPLPNGATTATADARSSLLRIDSRGVCVQCHPNP